MPHIGKNLVAHRAGPQRGINWLRGKGVQRRRPGTQKNLQAGETPKKGKKIGGRPGGMKKVRQRKKTERCSRGKRDTR